MNRALDRPARRILVLAGLGYLLFVIYGSLVPLRFRPLPLSEAWTSFLNIRYLHLGIASRADWVANILLFVPLAFLWLGVLWPRKSRGLQTAVSGLVLVAAVGLSAAIEFAQLFFPPRTVSLNDILAEGIGAGIGVVLWWAAGHGLVQWLEEWRGKRPGRSVVERLLYLYLFLLFGYNLLPLDLTISPVEIFHKWRAGRVVLVPFGYHFSDSAQALYDLLADIAVWVPVGYLWRLSAERGHLSVWLRVTSAAALVEFLQLFVYTRVSDVTDVLTAALGGGIGIVLARLAPLKTQIPVTARAGPSFRVRWGVVWPAVGLLAWLAVLALVFWYPFDFRFEGGFVRQRIAGLGRVPFEAYYFGTEYRAVTEVLHKTLFFAPGGALFALISLRMPRPLWRRLFGAGAFLFVALTALTIELGQLFLPRKIADLTDWALETLGGVLGYMATAALANRMKGDAPKEDGR